MPLVYTVCITLALVGLLSKLIHASAVMQPNAVATPISLTEFQYSGFSTYEVTAGFKRLAPEAPRQTISFPVNNGERFGQVGHVDIRLAEPTIVVTNVSSFPWNRLVVDGAVTPVDFVYVQPRLEASPILTTAFLAIDLPTGTHRIEYAFMPAQRWRALYLISWIVLLAWMAIYAILTVRKGMSHALLNLA
jgi:hypothetical protein